MRIIFKYGTLFVDGMGGLNSVSIEQVLDWEEVDPEKRLEFIEKIILYIIVSLEKRNEETTHGTEDRAGIRSQGQRFQAGQAGSNEYLG